ncbi:hypothetical protein [Actinosynnema mirum]|uniref:hypothetical protein n=1 Tax=Actinosynnema mirum TaxID=40567 RepID=UPI00117EC442|nr:hypothetical protein [Actinosynnema mirum]
MARWTGGVALVLGLLGLVARIVFVRGGILYGASAVARVDALVASLVALGAALAVLAWALGSVAVAAGSPSGGDEPRAVERWSELVSASVALGSVIAAVITFLNLVLPAVPASVATEPCAGAPVRHSRYIGLSAGTEGVNSRSGPSRGHEPNGRFPKGCSIGFEFFCLGDPVLDEVGSTDEITWVTSRWLVVSRQRSPFAAWLAARVSGEIREDRYVSDAYVTPQSSYDELPYGAARCSDGNRFPMPGKATWVSFDAERKILTAKADHARNMGFAVYVPGDVGFDDVPRYLQIYTSLADVAAGVATKEEPSPENNPGQASPEGGKSVLWRYDRTLVKELRASRGEVTVMAIPCLADNIPASTDLAAYKGYVVTRDSVPVPAPAHPDDFDKEQLARIACSANT